ncbi:MAG: T9SS type A sorting domain-containing protein, partial [Flavobacteriales bacterium]|nr:T9SS type A sorting domain-containing protein [Flavobacteriales bacterium]
IPANTPAGTGYRIRVNANSPATTGTDNGFDITIQPGTLPVASASAGGPTTFCDGGDVTLSAGTDPNYTYQWLLDGNAITGATDPDLLAGDVGTYSVVVSNVCGNDVSADIDVTVNALPVNELDQTSYTSCAGTAVTITAVDQSGLNNLDYVWTLDGNVIPGADQSSISATDAGAYAVEVTDSQTGCAYTSASATLAFEAIPVVTVSAQGSTTFCADGSVVLDAGNDPDLSYQWFLDGNAINGATASTLTADSTGTYTVVATSTGGCASDPSNSTDVTENPIPAEPVITQGTDTLYASGTGDFQWNLFGSPINGAPDAFIETAISGDYTVTVTVDGCSSTSAIYTYIATGVDGLDQSAVQVFPNPSAGAFTIQLSKGGAPYTVTDMTGKLVQQGLLNGVQNTLDLSRHETGVYILRITQDGASRSVRLMRN